MPASAGRLLTQTPSVDAEGATLPVPSGACLSIVRTWSSATVTSCDSGLSFTRASLATGFRQHDGAECRERMCARCLGQTLS